MECLCLAYAGLVLLECPELKSSFVLADANITIGAT